MEIIISSRQHVQIDQSIKTFIKDKLQRFTEEYHKLNNARIVIGQERSWFTVSIHIQGKNLALDAKAKDTDILQAIDAATQKVLKQLRKYVDKIQDHRVTKEPIEPKLEIIDDDEFDDDFEYETA